MMQEPTKLWELFSWGKERRDRNHCYLYLAGSALVLWGSILIPHKEGLNINSAGRFACYLSGFGLAIAANRSAYRLGEQFAYRQVAQQAQFNVYANAAAAVTAGQAMIDRTYYVPQLEGAPEPPALPPASTINDPEGEKLVYTLAEFKMVAKWLGCIHGFSFNRHQIKLYAPAKVAALQKLAQDLQSHLGISQPPLISSQKGYVAVDIVLEKEGRRTARFTDFVKTQKMPPNSIKFAVGVDLEGRLIEADLSDPNSCHFLVGGTTGSGKSELMRAIAVSLIAHHPPEHLQLAFCDPKRVTFPEFEGIPWLYSPIVKDSEDAIGLMAQVVEEMESRYKLFESNGVANINDFYKRTQKILPRIIVIFDEYADWMVEKNIKQALEKSIKRLGAMARAAGIHLILGTQRPEANVVTQLIRSNLPGRICLRTATEADSKIVLGNEFTMGAYLGGRGDMLYQVGSDRERLQALFVEDVSRYLGITKTSDHLPSNATSDYFPSTSTSTSEATSASSTSQNPEARKSNDSEDFRASGSTSASPETTQLAQAARLVSSGKSVSWVVENILGCKGRRFREGKQLLEEYLSRNKIEPQTAVASDRLFRVRQLLAQNTPKKRVIEIVWNIKKDAVADEVWQYAEEMLNKIIQDINNADN